MITMATTAAPFSSFEAGSMKSQYIDNLVPKVAAGARNHSQNRQSTRWEEAFSSRQGQEKVDDCGAVVGNRFPVEHEAFRCGTEGGRSHDT